MAITLTYSMRLNFPMAACPVNTIQARPTEGIWIGVKSDHPVMPDPEQLTYLKPGFERIEFSFPDVTGKNFTG